MKYQDLFQGQLITRNPRKAMSHLRGLSQTSSYLYCKNLFCSIQEIDGLEKWTK